MNCDRKGLHCNVNIKFNETSLRMMEVGAEMSQIRTNAVILTREFVECGGFFKVIATG
jgi:hypothetical protein